MTYRVNFGNGRTYGQWRTLAMAVLYFEHLRDVARKHNDPWYAFVQELVEGEWRRVRLESEES